MAGAGFKTFTVGEVLTAVNVNTFLMQQTVMVFADAVTRDNVISTPSEGMVVYLSDSNSFFFYTGSAYEQIVTDPIALILALS